VEATPKELRFYKTADGKRPFIEWYRSLTTEVRTPVHKRMDRVEHGNFGDAKPLGNGVFELRFHEGKGHRVYYGLDGKRVVLLLIGGDKPSQDGDIQHAKEYWKDYRDHEPEERSSSEWL
jgi:putative addiction module killer protein